MKKNFENLNLLTNKIADIKYAISVLNWDQETYMPSKGQHFRAQQIATLSGIAHELSTSKEYESAIVSLKGSDGLDSIEKRNVDLLFSDLEKSNPP